MTAEEKKRFEDESRRLKGVDVDSELQKALDSRPKKPPNAFLCFSRKERAKLKEGNRQLTASQVTAHIKEKWDSLNEEQKLPFTLEESDLMQTYIKEDTLWLRKWHDMLPRIRAYEAEQKAVTKARQAHRKKAKEEADKKKAEKEEEKKRREAEKAEKAKKQKEGKGKQPASKKKKKSNDDGDGDKDEEASSGKRKAKKRKPKAKQSGDDDDKGGSKKGKAPPAAGKQAPVAEKTKKAAPKKTAEPPRSSRIDHDALARLFAANDAQEDED